MGYVPGYENVVGGKDIFINYIVINPCGARPMLGWGFEKVVCTYAVNMLIVRVGK